MEKIFVDTGALIAIADGKEQFCVDIGDVWKKYAEDGYEFFTSDYVMDELLTWLRCRKKMNMDMVVKFTQSVLAGSMEIVGVDQEVFGNALRIMKHFKDQYFSFTDCTSFVILKMLGTKKVLSTDRHFTIAGFNNLVKL